MHIEASVERASAPNTIVNNAGTNRGESAAEGDPTTRLMRIARLVAAGQMELPVDAPRDDLHVIVHLVRQHHCFSLVRHIARCVARDLTTHNHKEISDERPHV